MKIGTDSILLGAWTPILNLHNLILDVGAGTGILSLMLAQRSNAEQIDAIEVEENAYEECVENFENSSWSDRLFCFHADLQEFVEEFEGEKYDLIISNPPFYSESNFSPYKNRNIARFQASLPFDHLLESVEVLLADEGVFSTIIPFKEEDNFLKIAADLSLFPFQITRVQGNKNTAFVRSLIAFKKKPQHLLVDELIIEIERHQYTDDYKRLTQDFYLKF